MQSVASSGPPSADTFIITIYNVMYQFTPLISITTLHRLVANAEKQHKQTKEQHQISRWFFPRICSTAGRLRLNRVHCSQTVSQWMQDNTDYINTGVDVLDNVLTVILSTSILIAGVVGCLLDNLLPGRLWSERDQIFTKTYYYTRPFAFTVVKTHKWYHLKKHTAKILTHFNSKS